MVVGAFLPAALDADALVAAFDAGAPAAFFPAALDPDGDASPPLDFLAVFAAEAFVVDLVDFAAFDDAAFFAAFFATFTPS